MKKMNVKKFVAAFLCALAICLPASSANPGSSADPLVTKSYIDSIIMPQIKGYVDSQIANANSNSTLFPGTKAKGTFNIVNVYSGQTIIGGKSSQMILRMGTAKIVATSKGGVCDVTSGYDLKNGEYAPANHLLIIPLDDGRGIRMKSNGIVMVSGLYTIK